MTRTLDNSLPDLSWDDPIANPSGEGDRMLSVFGARTPTAHPAALHGFSRALTSTYAAHIPRTQQLLERIAAWTPAAHPAALHGFSRALTSTYAAHIPRTQQLLERFAALAETTSVVDIEPEPGEPAPRELALAAVEALRRWLGYTDEQVAELAGIAPRSIPNWRNKRQQPYPATVRRLFEIHNLLSALVRRLGLHEAVLWAQQPVAGATRLDLLRNDRVQEVLADAAPLLFSVVAERPLLEEDDDHEPTSQRRDRTLFAGRARGARTKRRKP